MLIDGKKVYLKNPESLLNDKAPYKNFSGKTAVHEAWADYYADKDVHLSYDGDIGDAWMEENSFFVGVRRCSHEIAALRTYGKTMESPFLIYKTDWIPIFANQPYDNADEMEDNLLKIAEAVESAEKEFLTYEKPLVLIEQSIDGERYVAWSLKGKEWMIVHGYKSFRSHFYVSKDGKNFQDNGAYSMHVFPEAVWNAIGLWLDPESWELPSPGDEWERRDPRPYKPIEDECLSKIYSEAISLANEGRAVKHALANEFIKLEIRLNRFEKLYEFAAPNEVIMHEIGLIKSTMEEIQSQRR